MGKAGEVTVITKTPGRQLSALLHNFEIGSSVVKAEHQDWLIANVPPFLSGAYECTVVGVASPSGPDAFNLKLSRARAANVDLIIDSLELRKNGRRLRHVTAGLGEAAARLAGLKDGSEDERWRGVYVNITDPLIVPPPPVPPRKMVSRRIYVKVMLDDHPGKSLPMDPEGQRAEKIFNASRKIMQRAFDTPNIIDEKTQDQYADWTLAKITIKKNVSGEMYVVETLEVEYEWYPPPPYPWPGQKSPSTRPVPPKLIEKVRDDYKAVDPNLQDEHKALTPSQAQDWLDNPFKAFRQSH